MASAALQFFDEAHAAFLEAERVSGASSVERHFRVAGRVVRLRFAGKPMAELLGRALAHLETAPAARCALEVCVWDSASTGVAPPRRPWRFEDCKSRGEVRGFGDERIHVAFPGGDEALSLQDAARSLAVYWVPDARRILYHETSTPLRLIFSWWLEPQGLQLVHAAAVGEAAGGVLLAGRGGAGKSTTALACLGAGLSYAGDDYCVLGAEPEPWLHGLYSTGKADAASRRLLPFLDGRISNPGRLETEKALYFLDELHPERVSPGFPLRALLVPRITGAEEPRLQRISAASGLAALAPSTLFQLPDAGGRALQNLGRILRGLPCYSLELGPDLSRVPGRIRELLRRH